MNQESITINASEVSNCEYCEVAWSLCFYAFVRLKIKLNIFEF
jgi:hypothetical protein